MPVIVKIGWIGNGEFIQKVGLYGYSVNEDLGNTANCPAPAVPSYQWREIYPMPPAAGGTEFGEYYFSFPIRTGSVTSTCPGYDFVWVGTFFVETNRNTYWLNPDMDAKKFFYFDTNGYNIIAAKGGYANMIWTDREDMRYYNPLVCR